MLAILNRSVYHKGRLADAPALGRGVRKQFFSEEKIQKTFAF
jgi:hypothetical protein